MRIMPSLLKIIAKVRLRIIHIQSHALLLQTPPNDTLPHRLSLPQIHPIPLLIKAPPIEHLLNIRRLLQRVDLAEDVHF